MPLFYHFLYFSKRNTKHMSHLKELREEASVINRSQMLSDIFCRQTIHILRLVKKNLAVSLQRGFILTFFRMSSYTLHLFVFRFLAALRWGTTSILNSIILISLQLTTHCHWFPQFFRKRTKQLRQRWKCDQMESYIYYSICKHSWSDS